jgi:MFS family permease
MGVLVLEIVFTRVFSVLMSYHFAFMVISLALLGSGAAGIWLYLAEARFPKEKTNERLALSALLFAAGTVIAFWLYLQIPFEFKTLSKEGLRWSTVGWLALIYLVLSIPFLLGGATVALAISRFSSTAGKVYAFDLVGASLGCLVSVLVLTTQGAEGGVLWVALLAACAALLFSIPAAKKAWRLASTLVIGLLLLVMVANHYIGWLQVHSRGGYDKRNELIYERWNALSRVSVYKDPYWLQPFGWGLSPTYVGPIPAI